MKRWWRTFTRASTVGPLATREEYLRLWQEARRREYPDVDAYERSCGAAIDRDWFQQLALVTQVVVKRSVICYQHGRLLYAALRRYAREHPRERLCVVETGTARGFSALCLAKALQDAGAEGEIHSFDLLPHDVPRYWNCIRDADGPRTRAELLADYTNLMQPYVTFWCADSGTELHQLRPPRVHFAFLDSVHTRDHVLAEFGQIGARQRAGDITVFDDYPPGMYPGVVQAAEHICRSHRYTAQAVSISPGRGYLVAVKE